MKRPDIDTDHLVQLYQSGLYIKTIAEHFSADVKTITRRLRDAGVPLRGRAVPFDHAAALCDYSAGMSVKALAKKYGVQRSSITLVLNKHGITPRNRSDAMFLRMSQATPEERARLTEAAHAATRGRTVPEECLFRMAEGRERSKSQASFLALALAESLTAAGLPVTLEKAVGPYNVDLAISERSVAVEVQGGSWHAYGFHGSRLAKRREYLLSSGWHLVEVWVTSATGFLSAAVTDKLITLAESFSLDPAAPREHRVIGGDGKDAPVMKSYGYDVPAVDSAKRRCERTGRYLRVA